MHHTVSGAPPPRALRPTDLAARLAPLATATLLAAACDDSDGPAGPVRGPDDPPARFSAHTSAPELVDVVHDGRTLRFWPFTGRGPSADAVADPLNLVFVGRAHPLEVRAALLALDGERAPLFPAAFPFDCTWKDAVGRPQATFGPDEGWAGSAVQLECGEYDPIRFHVRLFELGGFTVGNAHLDVLIPGTSDHQVIAWEGAEAFVVFDLVRTGLLAGGPLSSGRINPEPSFREIPAPIYNGIPVPLRTFIGGPAGDVVAPVPIRTDGAATVVEFAGAASRAPERVSRNLSIVFDQVVPRPFCSTGPRDFVRLEGPLELSLSLSEQASGVYHSLFRAAGRLTVTPLDLGTGQPAGESYEAEVKEHHVSRIDGSATFVRFQTVQIELPPGHDPEGRLQIRWITGTGAEPRFTVTEDC